MSKEKMQQQEPNDDLEQTHEQEQGVEEQTPVHEAEVVDAEGTEEGQHAEEIDAETQTAEERISVEELLQKLQAAEQKAEEQHQRFLRAQADFENLKRRTQQEREAQAKYASLPLIEKLLPALDNLERALAASQETQDAESLAKGVEMVFRQVEEVLAGEGLEVIPTVGQKFDPNVHQAVMQDDSAEHEPGTVTEEFQKGYKLKDKVIRPAMVKVRS